MKYKVVLGATILGLSVVAFAANTTIAPKLENTQPNTEAPITNTVNLYQDANADSKVLSTISYQDLNAFKPIFTNKDGWTKVGSTQDGKIGWVKPLNERIEPLKTALLKVEKQQGQIVEKYRTEMFKAQHQESEIIKQLNAMSQFNRQIPNQPTIFIAPENSEYESTEVSYSSSSKDGMAQVKQTWLDKDGKTHSKTYDIPVKDAKNIVVQG